MPGTQETTSWRSPSASNYDLMPLHFLLLRECYLHDTWHFLENRWLLGFLLSVCSFDRLRPEILNKPFDKKGLCCVLMQG